MAFLLIILIFTAALSAPRSPVSSAAPTGAQAQEGGTVALGQPFMLKFGSDSVPVMVVFDSTRFDTTYEYEQADAGYKFLILQLTVQNIGTKEVDTFNWLDKWEVTVNKGYQYKSKHSSSFDVRPEEKKRGYVVFEILQDTIPIEVKYWKFLSAHPTVILSLKESSSATKTAEVRDQLCWSPTVGLMVVH